MRMILAGDVGGTKTLLEAGTLEGGRWLPVYTARYAAAEHADLQSVLREFFRAWGPSPKTRAALVHACFGVAGPVMDNRARLTNLAWFVDGDSIRDEFGIARVSVVNDFAAAASGIELLDAADLCVLQAGEPLARAPRLVIGAGTGLGVAHLVWAGGCYQVIAGEAGHAGFAPATLEQHELWRSLFANSCRVTTEDVVSGPGLMRLYNFIRGSAGGGSASDTKTPAEIVDAALLNGDAHSRRALDLFIACYGEAAGNLALGALARGGVFVAGGIAPKILPRLQAGGFLDAFNAKAAYADTMRKIPLSVVINERLGVLGCAAIAAR